MVNYYTWGAPSEGDVDFYSYHVGSLINATDHALTDCVWFVPGTLDPTY